MRKRLVEHPLRIVAMTGYMDWKTDPMALVAFDRILIKPLDLDAIRMLV